jgi:hypothetical protein
MRLCSSELNPKLASYTVTSLVLVARLATSADFDFVPVGFRCCTDNFALVYDRLVIAMASTSSNTPMQQRNRSDNCNQDSWSHQQPTFVSPLPPIASPVPTSGVLQRVTQFRDNFNCDSLQPQVEIRSPPEALPPTERNTTRSTPKHRISGGSTRQSDTSVNRRSTVPASIQGGTRGSRLLEHEKVMLVQCAYKNAPFYGAEPGKSWKLAYYTRVAVDFSEQRGSSYSRSAVCDNLHKLVALRRAEIECDVNGTEKNISELAQALDEYIKVIDRYEASLERNKKTEEEASTQIQRTEASKQNLFMRFKEKQVMPTYGGKKRQPSSIVEETSESDSIDSEPPENPSVPASRREIIRERISRERKRKMQKKKKRRRVVDVASEGEEARERTKRLELAMLGYFQSLEHGKPADTETTQLDKRFNAIEKSSNQIVSMAKETNNLVKALAARLLGPSWRSELVAPGSATFEHPDHDPNDFSNAEFPFHLPSGVGGAWASDAEVGREAMR